MTRAGFSDDFRRNFLTGFTALFPILITAVLLTWFYHQIDATIGDGFYRVLSGRESFVTVFGQEAADKLPTREARAVYARQKFPSFIVVIVGLGIASIGVYLLGKLLRGYLGRRVMSIVDRFFERFPLVKVIYPHARQVSDFMFGSTKRKRFSRVVAVQYPRMGIYTIGFVTGAGLRDIRERARREMLTVFIPTSPTPVTGFIIVLPADEAITVDMTVEEAFRYAVTAGMLVPRRQLEGLSAGSPAMSEPTLPASAAESEQQPDPDGRVNAPDDTGSAESTPPDSA
jgi:uncharacterized membrane protein